MTNVRSLVVAALLLVAAGLYVWQTPGGSSSAPTADSTTQPSVQTTAEPAAEPTAEAGTEAEAEAEAEAEVEGVSGLPVIAIGDLPPEALDTLDAIADGGPYEFAKDDSVFQNREGILPGREQGYYREYTVVTPGEDDRGARRIVSGADGEAYYTDDHYDSFSEIVE